MAVDVKIKSKGLFKKKIKLKDILDNKLSYGIMDENYRLIPNEKGDVTVIYDSECISRGIEISFEDYDILLRLVLPTSGREIELFYEIISRVCGMLKTEEFYRDDEKVNLGDINELIQYDREAGIGALKDIKEELSEGEWKQFTIFGVMNPLSVGQKEMEYISSDLEKLGLYLDNRQKIDAYYTAPHVYKNETKLFGVYAVGEDIPTIVPTEPYIIMNQIEGIEDWYVLLGGGNDNIVRYEDFIKAVQDSKYYDCNHIIVSLTKDEIDNIIFKYRTEI